MPPSIPSSSDAFDASQHIGLVNLGNTCFFNSVLQAISVTRPLHSLYHPTGDLALAEPASDAGLSTASLGSRPINRRKIPALLLTDEESKRPVIPPLTDEQADQLFKLMSLSNSFRFALEKTWKNAGQTTSVKAASYSPKALLKVLAKKFDQFAHYEQQDAHELLRLLLDAMRMEEIDFIKRMRPEGYQRSASLASNSSYRSGSSSTASLTMTEPSEDEKASGPSALANELTLPVDHSNGKGDVTPIASITRTNTSVEVPKADAGGLSPKMGSIRSATTTSQDPLWEEMSSLIDVLWGGQLASMVVCEGCRHVSHTYEDFLDLSLPLRPEDANSAVGLKERRANRVRLMADRWRRPVTPLGSSSRAKGGSTIDEKETILKQTLRCSEGPEQAMSVDPAPVERRRTPSSHLFDGAVSADEDSPTPSNNSWSAWAATLGRSRSARPATTAVSKSLTVGCLPEQDTLDMPDIASIALTPESTASFSQDRNEDALKRELSASLEAKSKGSRDLLTALSNASRANSRAGSRNRAEASSRSNSPGVERVCSPKLESSDTEAGRHHHHHHQHHLTGLIHGRHPIARKHHREPSKQAQYIARVFGEPGSSTASVPPFIDPYTSKSSFRNKIRAEQATTGLAIALRAFTTSEVLSDENIFNCKRCWRRLNPAKGVERERLRRQRARRGKNPSGSEDSDDDEGGEADQAEDDALASGRSNAATSLVPPELVAPKPQRAVSSLLGPFSAPSSEDEASDAEAIVQSEVAIPDDSVDGPIGSTIDTLEEGARTPISRTGSTQPHPMRKGSIVPLRSSDQGTLEPSAERDEQSGITSSAEPEGCAPAVQVPKLLGGTASPSASFERFSDNEALIRQANVGTSSKASAEHLVPPSPSIESSTVPTIRTSDRDVSASGDESDASLSSTRGSGAAFPAANHRRSLTTGDAPSAPRHAVPRPLPRQLRRSAQSLPRRALKRYLISSFPPVLVFHLKRFQANPVSRTSSFFSSSGNNSFKKIEDVVTYPQWLDMAEWMAPPREEYDRNGKLKESSDPRVWEASQRDQLPKVPDWEASDSATATIESHAGSGSLTNDGAGLKRKPSRWSKPFSRGPSGSASSNATTLAAAAGSIPTPKPSPSQSRVSSPALVQGAFQSDCADSQQALPFSDTPTPLYRLYGVVAHHGSTMHGGHYTSFVLSDRCIPSSKKNKSSSTAKEAVEDIETKTKRPQAEESSLRPSQGQDDQRQWVYCSDSIVKPATLDQVLKCKDAYLLWYERVA